MHFGWMFGFKRNYGDDLQYRKITSNMNEWFPDATADELNAGDATCIICREEMVTAKKLLCGHLFHVHCLRSWLERQHTCPTWRSLVVPPDNASHGSVQQHAVPSQTHHSGSGAAETSSQSLQNATWSNSTPHEMRINAAASASAIYQKPFVHSHTKWSPGYALVPQTSIQTQVTSNEEGRESAGTTSSQAPRAPSVWPNITFPRVSQYTSAQLAEPKVQALLSMTDEDLLSMPNEDFQRQLQGYRKELEMLELNLEQLKISVPTWNPYDAEKGKMVATQDLGIRRRACRQRVTVRDPGREYSL